MGTISSSVGLISGINTGAIIDSLIAIEQQPVTKLQARQATNTAQQSAFSGLEKQLTSLQSIGQSLERPLTFAAATATSSDNNVLTATTTAGATTGSFQFQVAQLVTAQQSITGGYASPSALVGAGNLSITLGGGNLNSQTALSQLNGGAGVPQGEFRITDRSGQSALIDASKAVTLDDVVQQINNSLNINVRATLQNNRLVLTDQSGQTTANLTVSDVGKSTTAAALGINGSVAASSITGSSINTIGAATALSALNDGRGVATARGAADFEVTAGDGSKIDVSLGASQTLGDVIDAINKAGGSKLAASLNPGNNSITLQDNTGGAGALRIATLNNSGAAHDLGLDASPTGNSISGRPILAGLDSVLVSSLHGGSGVPLGQISLTDRGGASATVDLSGATSVQDILDTINNTAGIGIKASLNTAGNGIQLTDTSGGTGNLVVADVNSTTAASLGLAGGFAKNVVNGGDLHTQFVSANTTLSSYNGGNGVTPGKFTITAANGSSASIDTSQGVFNTIGDVISAINAKSIGVTASINANGNGLLLTDNSKGAGHLTVTDAGGATAKNLGIAGTAAANTLDGSLQKTIAISATDTLSSVQQKIQQLGYGVGASIIDDGSGQNASHLSLTALHSGLNGRVVIDGGTTSLNAQTLVQAQNAAVFLGGGSGPGSKSELIQSETNQIANVVTGVTIQLQGVSDKPVTLNVSTDSSGLVTQLQSFTTTFNAVVTSLDSLTSFDTTTNQAGILLGSSAVQQVQTELYTALQASVQGAGTLHTLADVGITIGDKAQISFDASKFQAAYASDPAAVKDLFTQTTTGIGSLIDKSITRLVDPVSGVITLENQTLTNENSDFQTNITSLNALIADKKARLQQEFANMESTLATLQGQQTALGSLTGITSTPASSSSSSSSSSASKSSSTGG